MRRIFLTVLAALVPACAAPARQLTPTTQPATQPAPTSQPIELELWIIIQPQVPQPPPSIVPPEQRVGPLYPEMFP